MTLTNHNIEAARLYMADMAEESLHRHQHLANLRHHLQDMHSFLTDQGYVLREEHHHDPTDIPEETKEAQEALQEQQYHAELAREQADEEKPFSQGMYEDPNAPSTLAVDEFVRTAYKLQAEDAGHTPCHRCNGSGRHYGKCFRCKGKGFQTNSDRQRNACYDDHNRR